MAIFRELSDNVTEIGVMAVTIVLISILLNNFKTSAFVCPGTNGTHLFYNSTSDACCLGSATTATNCNGVNTSAINSVGSNVNTSVTGIGTPITYIGIIILVIVFTAILVMLITKLRERG